MLCSELASINTSSSGSDSKGGQLQFELAEDLRFELTVTRQMVLMSGEEEVDKGRISSSFSKLSSISEELDKKRFFAK